MTLVWRLGEGGRTGSCKRCRHLDGREDGDGWWSDLEPAAGGPPPLHDHCTCFVNDELSAEEFTRRITSQP